MGVPLAGAFVLTLIVSCAAQLSSQSAYYLDTMSDCDGRPRDIGDTTVKIYGVNTEPQSRAVTSCTLTLNAENVRTPYNIKIQFLAVQINDPITQFYVYDGLADGRIMESFHSGRQKPPNLNYAFTTGQQVTFKFSTGEFNRQYDIRLIAEPMEADVSRCADGTGYGCDDYNYNYRLLGTKEIMYIVGGVFGFVGIIVVVVVLWCYCKQRGVSQRWKEEKLGQVNTAASLHSLNGRVNSNQPTTPSTRPWTSESSRNQFASIRRSPNLPRAKIARLQKQAGSDSSVCSRDASMPMKRPLPPPQSISNSRSLSGRSRGARSHRYRDRDDDRFSDRSYSTDRDFSEKNYSEKNYRPPTYREAMRRNSMSNSSADETSFVQANDDHPQEVFVERVITPRVNKKKSPNLPRVRAPPPPEQDDTYDSIEPKKSDKTLLADKGAGSSEEETEESDTDNVTSEEESEEESEVSEDERKKEVAEMYAKPNKCKSKDKPEPEPQAPASHNKGAFAPVQTQPQQFQGAPYPGSLPQGVHQPQPRYGYPMQPGQQMPGQQYPPQMPGQQPQPQIPSQQVAYPQGQQQPFFPGQGLPTQGFPAQPAPQAAPHPYHQANFTVPIQSQGAPVAPYQPGAGPLPNTRQHPKQSQRDRASRQPAINKPQPVGGDTPMYSYLVNRGYRNLEGRHSPMSTSTGASNLSGDRNLHNDSDDFSPNIGSGVELMKRKN